MKRGLWTAAFVLVAVTGCGPSAEKDLLNGGNGGNGAIEELSQNFPRTFRADARYTDIVGNVLESASYRAENSSDIFGCIDKPDSFTVVMSGSGRDLRIRISGVDVRQSKSKYENLVKVYFDGQSPQGGFVFDSAAAGSDQQVEFCELVFQSASSNMAGQLTCRNVTSQADGHPQADLQLNFTCQAQ